MNLGVELNAAEARSALAVSKEPAAGTAPGLYGRIFGTHP